MEWPQDSCLGSSGVSPFAEYGREHRAQATNTPSCASASVTGPASDNLKHSNNGES